MRYCLAGHPPPLLRGPDGSVHVLGGAGGTLLGLAIGGRPEQVARYAPGSCLALFTDGLVERRGEVIDTGIARLAGVLRDAPPADPERLCDALVRQSVPRGGRDDDTAVLCAFLA